MKIFLILIATAVLVSGIDSLVAEDSKEKKAPNYAFEFKVAKQRKAYDKKGSSSNNSTSEIWNYKVEVENKSLQDVGELEVKYTCYISTETRSGGSRRETTRKVSGDGDLDPIARGNRSTLETKKVTLKQSEKTERKKSNNRNRNRNSKHKKTQIKVTEVREKTRWDLDRAFYRREEGRRVPGGRRRTARVDREEEIAKQEGPEIV